MPALAEVPVVEPYGRFSHIPTEDDYAIEASASDTVGALGARLPTARPVARS